MKLLLLSAATIMLFSCTVGDNYKRPEVAKPVGFKENKNWKVATPKDIDIKSKWWEVFGDPELNKLEEEVDISNQTIKQYEAAYRQARAVLSESKAAYYPTVSANASGIRSGTGSTVVNTYSGTVDTAWELDVWGRVRRTVESSFALSRASAGDLGAARLSVQASLATDYFSLRIADRQKILLDSTVKNYEKALQLTQNLYNSGVNGKVDVLQAKTQLENAQAQAIDIQNTRALLEHAIALLVGKAPSEFAIAVMDKIPAIPAIPVAVPSTLLERRPDVAAAEERTISANAQIGVAKAAYFPTISLTGDFGYAGSSFSHLATFPNRIWSIGPSLVETVFDGGLRQAQTKAAIAVYDQNVALYRNTVLTALTNVEDNLAALRILEQEDAKQQEAIRDATATTQIFLNQYKGGIVSYLSVTTAQNTELTTRISALTTENARLTAAVNLIKALGGGWEREKEK